jgi:site-specific DNA-methyltransferase (adenine-specific)
MNRSKQKRKCSTEQRTDQSWRNRILIGDVRQTLDQLPVDSVDMVITSPPYFRLRDYQAEKQIGLEDNVDRWVDELRLVLNGLKRVLKPSGSMWLNLGDTYSRRDGHGARPKSLLLAPERLALALVSDGWVLRNKIVWSKPNPMPTSVRDRLSCTWEALYFFSKSEHYFFDLDAIRVPHAGTRHGRSDGDGNKPKRTTHLTQKASQPSPSWSVPPTWRGPSAGNHSGLNRLKAAGLSGHPLGKNPGDVWNIPTASFRGAHHAVFPERLVERPIRAGCPEKVCLRCGRPWEHASAARSRDGQTAATKVVGKLEQACACFITDTTPGIVLDPFMGSGTTAVVAERLGRDWVGIEVNPGFARLAEGRIAAARIGVPRTTNESVETAAMAA